MRAREVRRMSGVELERPLVIAFSRGTDDPMCHEPHVPMSIQDTSPRVRVPPSVPRWFGPMADAEPAAARTTEVRGWGNYKEVSAWE